MAGPDRDFEKDVSGHDVEHGFELGERMGVSRGSETSGKLERVSARARIATGIHGKELSLLGVRHRDLKGARVIKRFHTSFPNQWRRSPEAVEELLQWAYESMYSPRLNKSWHSHTWELLLPLYADVFLVIIYIII